MIGIEPPVSTAHGERRVLIPQRIAPPRLPGELRVLVVKELGGETMGTTWSVKLAVRPGADLASIKHEIETVLAGVIDEMSPWEPTSHISRFNRAPAGTWQRLPESFFKVLSTALHWAERTGGAYDPTIGAAVNLWGFGPGPRRAACPDDEAIRQSRERTGWSRLAVDGTTRSVLQPGGVHLDLSSIAKGFAVDEVARVLRRAGIESFLVEIGGELRGEGMKPDGTPWWVALEIPREVHDALPETFLALHDLSVATSGDERRYFDVDGRRYAHTLDPRTGVPLMHDLVSVTVIAGDCMTADALATALLVLGPDQAPDFATEHRLTARFVRDWDGGLMEQLSPAMSEMLD